MQSVLLVWVLCVAPDVAVDTAVVCPLEFREALAPWIAHRQAQGRRIALVSNLKSPAELRGDIRRLARGGTLRYLVLVGDADPAMTVDRAVRRRSVPVHHSRAVINVRYGSTSEIATDNWYADLDDDRTPELAVGRIPSDSAEELAALVSKILAYENSQDFGTWRRQVNFVAGLGGFGAVADTVMEAAAKSLIGEGVPAAFSTSMTYGSWQSPYCPDPRQFQKVTVERLNEGSLFWVYMGHGRQRAVDEVMVPGATYPILSSDEACQLACRRGAPIACLLACYSGAFDQPSDCLAEDLLRCQGGPVAVLCGSRVTMPYAMSVMGSELLRTCFTERAECLGDALLTAKRRMMNDDGTSRHRAALDATAKALSPNASELQAELAEHLDLFNLLGDPLLRIAYPHRLELKFADDAIAGTTLAVTISSPVDGIATMELAVRRDRLTFQPPRRERFDPSTLDDYREVYERANQPTLSASRFQLAKGNSVARVSIPAEAGGACHVRVFVEGSAACAAGAAEVRVQAARTAAQVR
jgi:hypothetical protein